MYHVGKERSTASIILIPQKLYLFWKSLTVIILTFSSLKKFMKNRNLYFLMYLLHVNNKLGTRVFWKETNTDFHINWNSHDPIPWKWGTLQNLVQRSISTCSSDKLLEDELIFFRNVFIKINDCPPKLVNSIIKKELEKNNSDNKKLLPMR